jgi:hypothetical protein
VQTLESGCAATVSGGTAEALPLSQSWADAPLNRRLPPASRARCKAATTADASYGPRRTRVLTYRLEGCSAHVAILTTGACLATGTRRGNVGVVGLLAVGHGGCRGVLEVVGNVRRVW